MTAAICAAKRDISGRSALQIMSACLLSMQRKRLQEGIAMTPEAKLASMGLALPDIPKPIATYVSFKRHGDTLYLSGQGPRRNDGTMFTGKVGRDATVEQAYEHAEVAPQIRTVR
jgi:hypothetical protein